MRAGMRDETKGETPVGNTPMSAAPSVAERLLALEGAVAALGVEVGVLRAAAGAAAGAAGARETLAADGQGESGAEETAGGSPGAAQLAQLLENARLADVLARAGYGSPAAVAGAADEELLAIDGVGARALRLIRERVHDGQARKEQ